MALTDVKTIETEELLKRYNLVFKNYYVLTEDVNCIVQDMNCIEDGRAYILSKGTILEFTGIDSVFRDIKEYDCDGIVSKKIVEIDKPVTVINCITYVHNDIDRKVSIADCKSLKLKDCKELVDCLRYNANSNDMERNLVQIPISNLNFDKVFKPVTDILGSYVKDESSYVSKLREYDYKVTDKTSSVGSFAIIAYAIIGALIDLLCMVVIPHTEEMLLATMIAVFATVTSFYIFLSFKLKWGLHNKRELCDLCTDRFVLDTRFKDCYNRIKDCYEN